MEMPRKKPKAKNDSPDTLVQTRISAKAKAQIESLAALEGLSMASWLRRLVIVSLRASDEANEASAPGFK
jgi:hypothetical protein